MLASPGVYVGCLDGVEEELSHSDTLHVDEVGLEQSLRGLKPLSSHLDHTTIWQLEMCGRDEMKREGEKRKCDDLTYDLVESHKSCKNQKLYFSKGCCNV